jgi:hypothetical protein
MLIRKIDDLFVSEGDERKMKGDQGNRTKEIKKIGNVVCVWM